MLAIWQIIDENKKMERCEHTACGTHDRTSSQAHSAPVTMTFVSYSLETFHSIWVADL